MSNPYKVFEHNVGNILGLEEVKAVLETLEGDSLSWGPARQQFEKEFAAYVGVKHAISTTSCTAALYAATQALRLGKGDEVICTPQSFKATTMPLLARGVTVKFADINPNTLNIDPNTIEAKITPRTKAIYVMHYGGQPCEMDAILDIAQRHGLRVVEDAAHASGAEYKGRKIGSISDATCFSFQSLKNMTTLGEGGMLTTNSDDIAKAVNSLQMGYWGEMEEKDVKGIGRYAMPANIFGDHSQLGWTHRFREIHEVGTHFRMGAPQAAVGLVQLRKLDGMNERRRQIARQLNDRLAQVPGLTVQQTPPDVKHVQHLYAFFYNAKKVGAPRQRFMEILAHECGIQLIQRYWPLHLSTQHQFEGHKFGECPVVERVFFEEQVNLPINPRLTPDQVDYMAKSVEETVARLKREN